jgi:hypothetical protein
MSTRHTVRLLGRDHWRPAGPSTDAERRRTHGPLQPMEQPGFWRRLFRLT